jgi:hypothetical protein
LGVVENPKERERKRGDRSKKWAVVRRQHTHSQIKKENLPYPYLGLSREWPLLSQLKYRSNNREP